MIQEVRSEFEFYISDSTYYSSTNKLHVEQFENSEKIVVQSISLDEFTRDKKYLPSIIKIDVEGSELDVINGAKNLIRSEKPTIIMEVLDNKANKNSIFNYFKSESYIIYSVDNNILTEHYNAEDFETSISTNYIFITDNSLIQLMKKEYK